MREQGRESDREKGMEKDKKRDREKDTKSPIFSITQTFYTSIKVKQPSKMLYIKTLAAIMIALLTVTKISGQTPSKNMGHSFSTTLYLLGDYQSLL